MRTKNGVLRVIQLWDGESWRDSCMLYKCEMNSFFRRVTCSNGVVKARWRLITSDKWHIDYSSDYV